MNNSQKTGGAGAPGGEPGPAAPPPPRPLRDWSVERCARQAFDAPEQLDHIHLAGVIESGKKILTSRLRRTEGRIVTTAGGSTYALGEPSAEYLAWLAEHGMTLDEAQPVKVPG